MEVEVASIEIRGIFSRLTATRRPEFHREHASLSAFLLRRFSQSFIDIREKEKKRGARGLQSMQRDGYGANSGATITAELDGGATTEAVTAATPSKDLLELQEKITKEILSSKLQENEMKELQVSVRGGAVGAFVLEY